MEYIMNPCMRWKLQPVCHLTNALKNLIWSKVSWSELGIAVRTQGCRGPMLKVKPDPFSNGEGNVTVLLIMLDLHAILSLEKAIPYVSKELVTV